MGETVRLPAGPRAVGDLLRSWRSTRGKSQLALSLDAGVSQRHLSFIESGRSVASRQKLLELAEVLDIPLQERNMLFLAAGYAPIYAEPAWNDPQMKSITSVVERMLRQQEPFPALLMDRYWNVLATNKAAPNFFGLFVDMAAWPKPRNLLHLTFDPAGMQPFIDQWNVVSTALIGRVYREAVGHVANQRTQELIAALLAYPGVTIDRTYKSSSADLPMIPIGFRYRGKILNYFSIVSTIGTPTVVTAQELRIECMFPADEATEEFHLAIAAEWKELA